MSNLVKKSGEIFKDEIEFKVDPIASSDEKKLEQ